MVFGRWHMWDSSIVFDRTLPWKQNDTPLNKGRQSLVDDFRWILYYLRGTKNALIWVGVWSIVPIQWQIAVIDRLNAKRHLSEEQNNPNWKKRKTETMVESEKRNEKLLLDSSSVMLAPPVNKWRSKQQYKQCEEAFAPRPNRWMNERTNERIAQQRVACLQCWPPTVFRLKVLPYNGTDPIPNKDQGSGLCYHHIKNMG